MPKRRNSNLNSQSKKARLMKVARQREQADQQATSLSSEAPKQTQEHFLQQDEHAESNRGPGTRGHVRGTRLTTNYDINNSGPGTSEECRQRLMVFEYFKNYSGPETSEQAQQRLILAEYIQNNRGPETSEQIQQIRMVAEYIKNYSGPETSEQAQQRCIAVQYIEDNCGPETSEQARQRRLQQAQYKACQRAAQTQEKSKQRLQKHTSYMNTRRTVKTPEQAQLRRLQEATYKATKRAVEAPEATQQRLQQHALYMQNKRAAETPEQYGQRCLEQATYQATQRAAEVPETTQQRLQQHALYMQNKRAAETPEQYGQRCLEQAAYQATQRAAEVPETTQQRLQQHALYMQNKRAAETPEQYGQRCLEQAAYQATQRAAEVPETTQQRLQQHALYMQNKRTAETPEQYGQRCLEQAAYQATQRAAEVPETTQQRLQQHALYMQNKRAAETPEQYGQRCLEQAAYQATQRAAEAPETTQHRLEQHAQYLARQRSHESTEEVHNRRQTVSERAAQRRQTFIRNTWSVFEKAAFEYDTTINYADHRLIKIDTLSIECRYCKALKWKDEIPGMCCSRGKVSLPLIEEPVEPLKQLFSNDNSESRIFLGDIRKYNSSFHMTSFGADKVISMAGFSPTFTIQGQIYHRVGSLLPPASMEPKYLQVYFMGDEEAETERRSRIIPGVHAEIVRKIQRVLHENNALVREFKTALENMPNENCKIVIHPDRVPRGQHERRYNAPTANEIAVVMVGTEQTTARDIVLRTRDGMLSRISDTHRFYDALEYPIIFWKGQESYHFDIPLVNPSTGAPIPNKKVSCKDFYAYHMMVRPNDFNLIMRCRLLLNQFLVDMYVKIESERLRYIALNQTKLRAENYIHLQDAVRADSDVNPNTLGQMIILPSSFVNSPRYLHEYTQDAFAYVRNYGRPDLFITLTCNPAWTEIKEALMPGQTAVDRHDIVARVFHLKVQKLVALLKKGQIFGEARCFVYSIEWQKRGLPHVHLLLWLREKLRPNQIDNIISAEIPDPDVDETLHDIIVKHMIHGPCGVYNQLSPCMKEGKCTKKYPRALLENTHTNVNGYPLYMRRAPAHGGRVFKMKIRGRNEEVEVDNSWIVPYSPLLSKIFNAHLNVEFCGSVQAIKYICKYICKGNDQAIFSVQQGSADINIRDEVQVFRAGRYVSSNEAAWRILGLPLHERYPTVTHLAVHLPNGERVYFTEQNFRNRVASPPKTTLTAFFKLCESDNFARTLLYSEVPRYYTWNTSRKEWKRRLQGTTVDGWPGVKAADALGRIYTVHVSNFECFCLRILLNEVRGPTSFQMLKTVDDEEKATFREACESRGLLENDNHWDDTMAEAVLCRSAAKVRELFAILVTTCGLSNPLNLWMKYKNALSEDIAHRLQDAQSDIILNEALILIENKMLAISGKCLADFGLPTPQRRGEVSNDVARELSYDITTLEAHVNETTPKLLPEQRAVVNTILNRLSSGEEGLFFLDAPGGTGKTFVLNLLLAKVRMNRNIALAVASSGIAATLLDGGRTAHSVFKLPLNLASEDAPTCNISKNSGRGILLQQCKLIVWDECTMAHKHALEALNRSLQDIRDNRALMGGVIVLLAGDFRQTLPVIERGTPADEINACLKASPLWLKIEKLNLTCNMRVQLYNDHASGLFASKLLQIGEGRLKLDSDGKIEFSDEFSIPVETESDLIQKVFPDLQNNLENTQWLRERAVLSPTNEWVNKINKNIIGLVAGNSKLYKSMDTTMANDDSTTYPIEFLNSLELPGVPSHNLELKVGVPVILMRNLDAPRLCNGTRLRITELGTNIIKATIITGVATGDTVLIPRIPIIPNNTPFLFKRLQFPLKLAFCMTINKSQGQTLKVAGIHLGTPCFSHGQLYVGCSGVSNAQNLYVLAENNKSYNVVYRNVLE